MKIIAYFISYYRREYFILEYNVNVTLKYTVFQ